MNMNPNTSSWRALENQIGNLRTIEERIQDLRTLLAEDWRMRLSQVQSPSESADYGSPMNAGSVLVH